MFLVRLSIDRSTRVHFVDLNVAPFVLFEPYVYNPLLTEQKQNISIFFIIKYLIRAVTVVHGVRYDVSNRRCAG